MALAQESYSRKPTHAAKLSKQPFGSTGLDGRAGTSVPTFGGPDSAMSNPASIGINDDTPSTAWVKHFHFPLVYGAYNEHSKSLLETISFQGGLKGAEFQESVIAARDGKPQYSRASLFPNARIGQVIIGPIYDIELASTKIHPDNDIVEFAYQRKTGAGLGWSIVDPSGSLKIGLFAHYLELERFQGSYISDQVMDISESEQLIEDGMGRYKGLGLNVGLLWKMKHKMTPVVSLRAKDVGGTHYFHQNGSGESFTNKQDLGIGLGFSPQIFSQVFAHIFLEGNNLTNDEVPVESKGRLGGGLTFGGRDAFSICGVNMGLDASGFAYGGHLNIGLIGVQYANFAVDVGTEDHRAIERRQSGSLSINLAQ